MSIFNQDKIPEHEKVANNFFYKLIDEYTLEQQNEIIKIIKTKIIERRRETIKSNQFALDVLEKRFYK